MQEAIDLLYRVAFAGMWLRLVGSGLYFGPEEKLNAHWHLRQELSAQRDHLAALLADPKVAAMFSDATEINADLLDLMQSFIDERCIRGKGGVLSGLALLRTFYPWSFKRGSAMPTQQQLYSTMDGCVVRAPSLDKGQGRKLPGTPIFWERIRVKPEYIPRTYSDPAPKIVMRDPTRLELAQGITERQVVVKEVREFVETAAKERINPKRR